MSNNIFYKFLYLSGERKKLLLEASFKLLLARVAIKCLPFKWIEKFMNSSPCSLDLQGKKREHVHNSIRWAINRAPLLLPGSTVCFPRGIVAQDMLRRRGVHATLYYGATSQINGTLRSHVWVKDNETEITGCREAIGYKVIARYPNLL